MDFNDLFNKGTERHHLVVTTNLSSIDKPLVIGLPVHNGNKHQCAFHMQEAKDEYEIALPYTEINVAILKSSAQTRKPPVVYLSSDVKDFRAQITKMFIPSKRSEVFYEKVIQDLADDYKQYPIDMFKSDWQDVFETEFKKSKVSAQDRLKLASSVKTIWSTEMVREYWQDKICEAYTTEDMVMALYPYPEGISIKKIAKTFANFTEIWVLDNPTKQELKKARKEIAEILEAAYAVDPVLMTFHWGSMNALLDR